MGPSDKLESLRPEEISGTEDEIESSDNEYNPESENDPGDSKDSPKSRKRTRSNAKSEESLTTPTGKKTKVNKGETLSTEPALPGIAVEVPPPSSTHDDSKKRARRPTSKRGTKAHQSRSGRAATGSRSKPRQEKISDLKRENKELKNRVNAVTKESIRNAIKGGRAPKDDRAIRNDFRDLDRKALSWVRSYSVRGRLDLGEREQALLESMLNNPGMQICAVGDLHSISQLTRASAILLQGMLFQFIGAEIIMKPFLFLDGALDKPLESKKGKSLTKADDTHEHTFEEGFMRFASKLAQMDRYHSNQWVARVLDAVKPLISPESEDGKQPREDIAFENYKDNVRKLAERFLKHPTSYLLKQVHGSEVTKRRNELIDIIKGYRELSFQLWYQGCEVKCYYLGSDRVSTTYDPESESMELHNAYKVSGGIEGQNSLSGRRVMLVTKPAIGAVWVDPEDREVERSKIWVKSVVWIREDGYYEEEHEEEHEEGRTNIPGQIIDTES